MTALSTREFLQKILSNLFSQKVMLAIITVGGAAFATYTTSKQSDMSDKQEVNLKRTATYKANSDTIKASLNYLIWVHKEDSVKNNK